MIKADIVEGMDERVIPQEIWDRLCDCCNINTPFQNRDWLYVWLKTVGSNTKPFFIRLMQGETIVGFIPLVISLSAIGPIRLRTLKFAGQPEADYSEFMIGEDKRACLTAMFSCIIAYAEQWDVAEFDHLCDSSSNFPCLQEVLEELGLAHQVALYSVLPYAEIGHSFENYWALRSKNTRIDIDRKERRLERVGEVTFKRYHNEQGLLELESFFDMLQTRDGYKDRLGTMQSYEKDRIFITELMRNENLTPYIHFTSLTVNDTPIAYHFGFQDRHTLYYYKPAYSTEYMKYSPSRILLKRLTLDCVESKINIFDFLLGDEPYKYNWSTSERKCYNVRVFHQGLLSRIAFGWLVTVRPRIKKNDMIRGIVKKVRRWLSHQ